MFDSGWVFPVLISVGLIVVLAAMEMFSLVAAEKLAAEKPVSPVLTGKGTAKAA